MEARVLTVGPLAENCFVVSHEGRAFVVDPGDEPDRILHALEGLTVEGILLTHTHFDHIGAVAPVARATGAPVWCPEIELAVLADPMAYVPFPGIGPFEGYAADHALRGGETLELAGFAVEVVLTPGHSPGHVTFATGGVLLSGDVLFAGSVGRTDLPGGDHAALMASIATLLERFDDDTAVLPGHGGATTLGRERASNPFLLAQR